MEHQKTEWKTSWHDEYLKWICAFANAQGGVLEIGKDDKGNVVGLENAEKLLEDIPNKITNTMGIVEDIDLIEENDKKYIRITVSPYANIISYHGKLYYRSGSTTQELRGSALSEFLMKKQGKNWDDFPIPDVTSADLDLVAFREFRKKALASKRLTQKDLELSDSELIYSLQLMEGKFLKRAAILLFHENPEKWVLGAYVKIGFFETGADLIFQDEVHGSLIEMPDKVLDLIYHKYFKAIISYEGIQRVETYPLPQEAMREAILNAIIHKDYSSGVPIQIKIFDDKVMIFNTGGLLENWTIEKLLSFHGSSTRNPSIASTFFRSGMVESWGRGIEKIMSACKNESKPQPEFDATKSDMAVIFSTISDANITNSITNNDTINQTQEKILELMANNPKITVQILSEKLSIAPRNIKSNIKKLKELNLIQRSGTARTGYWTVKK